MLAVIEGQSCSGCSCVRRESSILRAHASPPEERLIDACWTAGSQMFNGMARSERKLPSRFSKNTVFMTFPLGCTRGCLHRAVTSCKLRTDRLYASHREAAEDHLWYICSDGTCRPQITSLRHPGLAKPTRKAFVNDFSLCESFHELIEQQQQCSPLEFPSASAPTLLSLQMHSLFAHAMQ